MNVRRRWTQRLIVLNILNHSEKVRVLFLEPLPNQRFIAFDRSMQWLLAGDADLRQLFDPGQSFQGQWP